MHGFPEHRTDNCLHVHGEDELLAQRSVTFTSSRDVRLMKEEMKIA